MLGICRGSQVLNVAAGGTLVQDVPSTGSDMLHMGPWTTVVDEPSLHEIEVLEGTRLAEWLGAGKHVVNSYHHQAVERLGDGLRAAAVAPDGTIEATESTNGAFAVGLQWHNEFHMRDDERFARPLQALVSAARTLGTPRRTGGGRVAAHPPRPCDVPSILLDLQPGAVREHERRDQRDVDAPRPVDAVRACR